MTAYGTVAYYRQRLSSFSSPENRRVAALAMIAVASEPPALSDRERVARVRNVLAALDEVRGDE